MAEHPRTSREFASAPPHADAGTKQWVSSLLPVLQRSYMNVRVLKDDANIDRDDSVLVCNTGTGNITVTLPPVEQVTGKVYSFKKTASSNTLTIDPHNTDLIDGSSTSKTLTALRSGFSVISTGTAWESVPPDYLNIANIFTEDQTIGDGTEVAARLILDAQAKQIRFNKGGELRWIIQVADDDDDGDNDGGDLTFIARNDSGGNIVTAISVERATGAVTLGHGLTTASGRLTDLGGALTVRQAGAVTFHGSSNVILEHRPIGAGVIQHRFFGDDTNLRYIWQMTTGDDDGDDDGNELALFFYDDSGSNKGRLIRMDRQTSTGRLAFFNTAPVAKPTGVAVSAAGIHAALTSLGLLS